MPQNHLFQQGWLTYIPHGYLYERRLALKELLFYSVNVRDNKSCRREHILLCEQPVPCKIPLGREKYWRRSDDNQRHQWGRSSKCSPKKSKSSGYTGLSILYRLNKLCGFDIFNDLVIDTMHNIPMNVISSQMSSQLKHKYL